MPVPTNQIMSFQFLSYMQVPVLEEDTEVLSLQSNEGAFALQDRNTWHPCQQVLLPAPFEWLRFSITVGRQRPFATCIDEPVHSVAS